MDKEKEWIYRLWYFHSIEYYLVYKKKLSRAWWLTPAISVIGGRAGEGSFETNPDKKLVRLHLSQQTWTWCYPSMVPAMRET
jgi:hypothetical protein